ncbi:hypothetical protein DL770_005162 [Monosporascus sp. CRB-9-2]|nr:hypothetical protein DL770_005162 [Monosporascus sp. CRB-9-2]
MLSPSTALRGVLPMLLLSDLVLAAVNGACPPLGPVLPAPTNPSAHEVVQAAAASVEDAFQNITSTLNATGISVALKSIHEESSILELHYTPQYLNPNGTSSIDGQSVYRLGSISKIFAVLAVLKLCSVKFDDPVTKYVPELRSLRGETPERNDITAVQWDQVTIGALASHMSGIGTDLVADLASVPGPWTQLGLPELDESLLPNCAGVLGLPPCDRAQFFDDFGKRHPVYAPFTTPVYSNVASVILGYVVEAVSNTTYDDFVRRKILGPLGMTNTTIFSGPAEDAWGFIPLDETWWGASLGYEDMAGGFYSNTADLLAFGSGILRHELLDAAATRKWMKPASSTSSPGLVMGGPWEILRSTTATADGRLVEFYCKAGNLNTYNNMLCLIPDYGLVMTILSGGAESNNRLVDSTLSAVVREMLPAIEAAGKAQAGALVGGTYSDAASNSSVTLSLDEGPGFKVSDWVVRGVDVISNYGSYGALSSGPTEDITVNVRLYPAGLDAGPRTAWRAVFDVGTPEEIAAYEKQMFWPSAGCATWGKMDRFVYQFRSLDDFVIEKNEGGEASTLTLRGFQVDLKRDV